MRSGCLPHARGGVSVGFRADSISPQSSPRPWGCFQVTRTLRLPDDVFPTPVGVFPKFGICKRSYPGLPHARGGVSQSNQIWPGGIESSPRPWGCFYFSPAYLLDSFVFPTPVGVFLPTTWHLQRWSGLPHARGGVSTKRARNANDNPSSPRPWGCF